MSSIVLVMVAYQRTWREESMCKAKQISVCLFGVFLFGREWVSLIASIPCEAPQRMLVSYNSYRTEEISITCWPQVLAVGD